MGLLRRGDVVRRTVIAVAVVGTLLGLSATPAFAAKPHPNSGSAGCAAANVSTGAAYTVSASGLAANTAYDVNVLQPDGMSAGSADTSNSSGSFSDWGYAYWSGTYYVSVVSQKSGSVVASCSFSAS